MVSDSRRGTWIHPTCDAGRTNHQLSAAQAHGGRSVPVGWHRVIRVERRRSAGRASRLYQGLRVRVCRSLEAASQERAAVVLLAMLQVDPGLAGVAAGGDDRAVAAWAPLRLVPMDAVRIIDRDTQPCVLDLDLADG